ncbi:MAG: oxidoreductase [Rhodobacterales bacterium 12-65-15]|nr:MAG: oxidoreductase [Rhodobacterales bacterium 12-65-15]
MSVIVTDTGFAPATQREVVALADLADQTAVDLANTDDPQVLVGRLDQLTLIRVAFPAFNDGRAFTIARRLRELGYTGQLLALGPVIADQYAMLRRVGFDGAEIPDDLAQRQPADQWQFRADWRAHQYQSRLRA